MATISRNDFEDKFPVMFQDFQEEAKLTKSDFDEIRGLEEHWEEKGVKWQDDEGNKVPVFPWCVTLAYIKHGKKAKQLCMSWNHPSGYGCLCKECRHTQECLCCGSNKHGFFFRKDAGQYVCPRHKKLDQEWKDFTSQYGDPSESELKKKLKKLAKSERDQKPKKPSPQQKSPSGFSALESDNGTEEEESPMTDQEMDTQAESLAQIEDATPTVSKSDKKRKKKSKMKHAASSQPSESCDLSECDKPVMALECEAAEKKHSTTQAQEGSSHHSETLVIETEDENETYDTSHRLQSPSMDLKSKVARECETGSTGAAQGSQEMDYEQALVSEALEHNAESASEDGQGNGTGSSPSVDGTGSTPSTVVWRSDAEKKELKRRFLLARKYRGDELAFATSRECLHYLTCHGHKDELEEYELLAKAANVARHPVASSSIHQLAIVDEDTVNDKMSRYEQSVPGVGLGNCGEWPVGSKISDLQRNRSPESKILLESLCLHFHVHSLPGKKILDRTIGSRLGLSLRDVLSKDTAVGVTIAFANANDKRVFLDNWTTQLDDIICDVKPYSREIYCRENTVWFFNFYMDKLSKERIEVAAEAYGDVLSVNIQSWHDVDSKTEVPKRGFVEFQTKAGAQSLIKDRKPLYYHTLRKTFEVIEIPRAGDDHYDTRIDFSLDSRAGPPTENIANEEDVPQCSNDHEPQQAPDQHDIIETEEIEAREQAALMNDGSGYPAQLHEPGEVMEDSVGNPAVSTNVEVVESPAHAAGSTVFPHNGLHGKLSPQLESEASEKLELPVGSQGAFSPSLGACSAQKMKQNAETLSPSLEFHPGAAMWHGASGMAEGVAGQISPTASLLGSSRFPTGAPGLELSASESDGTPATHQVPLDETIVPMIVGSAVGPWSTTTLSSNLLFSAPATLPDAGKLAEQRVACQKLDKLIPGMGKVMERARLLELDLPERGVRMYVQKITQWVIDNEAVEGKEVLEDIEDLARYAAMKEKPLKRLKTALMDEYRE